MSDIDPEEAVAIVREAATIYERDFGGKPPHSFCEETMRRILAAVKPKGPWPVAVVMGEVRLEPYTASGNTHKLAVYNMDGDHQASFTEIDVDRLVVAWLEHRGVDLSRVHDEYGCLPEEHDIALALRSILDNAKGVKQ